MSSAADRLSLPRLVAFSLPGFSIGALAVALGVFLPNYYAAHLALPLAAVGAAFGLVRFGDMFLDPMIGLLMDRTRTGLGRYRVWMAAGAPVLMVPVYMLFSIRRAASRSSTWLAGFWFIMSAGR